MDLFKTVGLNVINGGLPLNVTEIKALALEQKLANFTFDWKLQEQKITDLIFVFCKTLILGLLLEIPIENYKLELLYL